jgi:hypothetical protein
MVAFLDKCGTKQVGTRNWFTLDLLVTRVKGLAKRDCIADEAAITKELK